MKTALIHEWLTTIGGSENVLGAIYEMYPSPIFTLLADKDNLRDTIFKDAEINTSFIQNLPFAKKKYRNYLNFFPLAVEQFDLSDFNVLLSSSHCVAKGVLTRADQLHICYCHSPVRYAWDLYQRYMKESGISRGVKAFIAKRVIHRIRIWDIISSNRVDYFIANSKHIAAKIKKIYKREAEVIYPPVDVKNFSSCFKKENFYLAASRMVPYKMMPLIAKAFSKIPDKKLVIIGDGPEYKKVKRLAKKNIELLGYQPFNILKEYLGKAKAFVFAAEEDFGILPVEAQACGTPVIAFGKGGALETVVSGKSGIFFNEQSEDSLINAIYEFEKIEDSFQPDLIHKGSEKFSKERFKKEFRNSVNKKMEVFF